MKFIKLKAPMVVEWIHVLWAYTLTIAHEALGHIVGIEAISDFVREVFAGYPVCSRLVGSFAQGSKDIQ